MVDNHILKEDLEGLGFMAMLFVGAVISRCYTQVYFYLYNCFAGTISNQGYASQSI